MAATLTSPPPSLPLLRPNPHANPMPLPRPSIPVLRRHHRRLLSVAAAVRQDLTTWTSTPLSRVSPASGDSSLFHVAVDLSSAPDLAGAFTSAGQYVQVRIPSAEKSSFLAIASTPEDAVERGEFEFLVKRIAGSTAEGICGMRSGDLVEIGGVMGKGFQIERVEGVETVLIFATGSGISDQQRRTENSRERSRRGVFDLNTRKQYLDHVYLLGRSCNIPISPIRSLIESGFGANKRSDVRLYYGARNLQRMAYQDRFKDWEATGVRIVPVLSQPDDLWKGERGYIQAAFSKAKQISDSSSTGAVLCGHKQMTEEVTSVLVADGVSADKILKNF